LLRFARDDNELQEGDEGDEAVALQPILVEHVGWPVRGRHEDNPGREECDEQPLEDRRIGNVGDLELVEA
jgi:hypothetical protein